MKRVLELALLLLVAVGVLLAYQKRKTTTILIGKKKLLQAEMERLDRTLLIDRDIIKHLQRKNAEERRFLDETSAELTRLEGEEKSLRRRIGDAKTVKNAVKRLEEEILKTENAFRKSEGKR